MIGNISRGSGFGGLVRYLLHGDRDQPDPERVSWVVAENLPTDDPEMAASVMHATADQNPRGLEKPVWHLSLSWDPGDEPSRAQMEDAAHRVLHQLGLSEHQALVVAHRDTDHPHVHIVVNRVHPENLRVWKGWQDMVRVERALRYLELENGYRATPGNLARLPGQERPDPSRGLSRGEVQESRREGQEAWTSRMRETLRPHFREAESWGDLEARLGEYGVRLQKKGRGLVVTDGTRQVKASRIDRKGSIHKLEARFEMPFNDWRDRVRDLQETVETYQQTEKERQALHLQHSQLKKELEQAQGRLDPFNELVREQREVKGRLQRQLGTVYGREREAESFRAVIDLARSTSYERAAQALRADPKILGRLAGGGVGPTADVVRREALATVPRAAESIERLGRLRREIAERVDRELRPSWEQAGRSPETSDRGTRVWQRKMEASQEIERLLPQIYRRESLAEVRDSLKWTRAPARTAELLTQNPHSFGRLRGRRAGPLQSQERKAALSLVPRLGAAVEQHGQARSNWIRLAFEVRNAEYRSASDRFDRTLKGLDRIPSRTKLLLKVARATERAGLKVVGQVLPVPREIRHLMSATRGLSSIAQAGRAPTGGTGGRAGSGGAAAPRAAVAAARLAANLSFRVLTHVLPGSGQVAVVAQGLRFAASLARTAGREMSR